MTSPDPRQLGSDGARRSPRGPAPASPAGQNHRAGRLARLQALDDRLLRQVVRFRRSPLTLLLRLLCRLHDPDVLALLICAALFIGPVGVDVALHATLALVFTSVVVIVVKTTVRRARPHHEVQAQAPPDRFSFPSGHTAAAFALAISMFGAVPLAAPLLVLLAILVGWGRMYLGVHYPVDVLGGVFVGVLVGAVVALVPMAWFQW